MFNAGEQLRAAENKEEQRSEEERNQALASAAMETAEATASSSSEDLSATQVEADGATAAGNGASGSAGEAIVTEGGEEGQATPEDIEVEVGEAAEIIETDEKNEKGEKNGAEKEPKDGGEVADDDYEGIPDYEPLSLKSESEKENGGNYYIGVIWPEAIQRRNPELSKDDVKVAASFVWAWNKVLTPEERKAILSGDVVEGFEGMVEVLKETKIISAEESSASGDKGADSEPGTTDGGDDKSGEGDVGEETGADGGAEEGGSDKTEGDEGGSEDGGSEEASTDGSSEEGGEEAAEYEAVSIEDIINGSKEIDTEKAIKKLESDGQPEGLLQELPSIIKYSNLKRYESVIDYCKLDAVEGIDANKLSSFDYLFTPGTIGYIKALVTTGLIKAPDALSSYLENRYSKLEENAESNKEARLDFRPLTIEDIVNMNPGEMRMRFDSVLSPYTDGSPLIAINGGILNAHLMTFADLIRAKSVQGEWEGEKPSYKEIVDYVKGESTLPDSAEKRLIDALMDFGLLVAEKPAETEGGE